MFAAAIAALMLFAGAGTALSAPKGDASPHNESPDENDKNDHGQCTAFFNGKKKGHGTTVEQAQAMYDACEDEIADGLGGHPEKGRFPQCFDDDDCSTTAPPAP